LVKILFSMFCNYSSIQEFLIGLENKKNWVFKFLFKKSPYLLFKNHTDSKTIPQAYWKHLFI